MNRSLPLAALGLIVIISAATAGELAPAEKEKIEALIKHVGGLEGAKFIRNGSEYDASAAARFLRGKWDANKAEIKTAKDFVEKVATKSGTSGRPYQIRLKGGKDQPAGEYLLSELKKLEK